MEFRIRWESDSKDKEKIYVTGTKKDAEDMFLRDQDPRTESLIIECDEGIFNAESDLQKELRLKADRREKKGLELENQNETKQQVNQATSEAVSSDNFQPILHKLDEIHSTMKAIRWTIAGGFLFIILVISGIIKPGIFG